MVHKICQVISKNRNLACLVEIKRTAHKLETNDHTNFPMAESMAYQYGEWSVKYAYLLSDSFSSLCVSSTMLKESQGSTQVSRERAKCSLSLVHLTNVEKGNNSVGN